MKNYQTWQELLSLESQDVVTQWFFRVHSRELNARRAKEINAAAKQAREYFKNAREAAFSVRPLLTFYGVASLSRALTLLMKASGGEEGLTASHGLETVNWGQVIDGEVSDALRSLSDLKIKTTAGLFSDFISSTNNRVSIHVSSSAVDWRLSYGAPAPGFDLSLGELLARLPDLREDFSTASGICLYSRVNEMTFSEGDGFKARVREDQFLELKGFFEHNNYTVTADSGWCALATNTNSFKKCLPMFVHSYVRQTFGAIPDLHITKPFESGAYYSQLGITYMVSYILGMLVRYYPTHWIALIQNEKGDTWWPTINMAQHYVETSFPKLVIELIQDILKERDGVPLE